MAPQLVEAAQVLLEALRSEFPELLREELCSYCEEPEAHGPCIHGDTPPCWRYRVGELDHAVFVAEARAMLRSIEEIEAERDALVKAMHTAAAAGDTSPAILARFSALSSARHALDWALGSSCDSPLAFIAENHRQQRRGSVWIQSSTGP